MRDKPPAMEAAMLVAIVLCLCKGDDGMPAGLQFGLRPLQGQRRSSPNADFRRVVAEVQELRLIG
jgi:hypothetical protein